jgi:hypothetical protein
VLDAKDKVSDDYDCHATYVHEPKSLLGEINSNHAHKNKNVLINHLNCQKGEQ